jgi:hypothetical protein
MDTWALADVLRRMDAGLPAAARVKLRDAVANLRLASQRLDLAGDSAEASRVAGRYKEYSAALGEILKILQPKN